MDCTDQSDENKTGKNRPKRHKNLSWRKVKPTSAVSRTPGFWGRIRNYFLAGLLITGPVAFTFYLAWLAFEIVDRQAATLIPSRYNPETYLPFSLPGLGILMLFLMLTVIGWAAAGYVGRLIMVMGQTVMKRLPVLRSVHGAIKQILETVLAQQSTAFREVVLLEYPRKGLWALAFLTGETQGEVQEITDQQMVNVFLPTTPNPTSGFLLFVPEEEVHILDMSVEEGIKMVISAGIITPPKHNTETSAPEQADEVTASKINSI